MKFQVGYLTLNQTVNYIECNSFAAAAGTAEGLSNRVRFIMVQLDETSDFEITHVYHKGSNTRYIANKNLVNILTEKAV